MATGKKKLGMHWREGRRADVGVKADDTTTARQKLAVLVRASSFRASIEAIVADKNLEVTFRRDLLGSQATGLVQADVTDFSDPEAAKRYTGKSTTADAALERAVTAFAEGEKKA